MKKFLMRRIGFSLIAVLVMVLITSTHAIAQQVPFYWDYIHVNIDVQTNGDMLVTEEQKYVFESAHSHKRYRYIYLNKVDEIRDVTVQENNQIIPSKTGIQNNQFWIRWQHQLTPPEARTFILKYRVVGGLHINGQNTQVYWKAIFPKRKAPVNAAKIRVKLPELLSSKVLNFTNFGTPATASQVNSRTFEFVANQSILPQQELEVQITFPSNILNLTQPNWQKGKAGNPIFLGFIYMFFFMFLAFTIICLINHLKCPQCKKLTLNRTYKVLLPASTRYAGTRRVICHCKNCSYHNEYKEVIPLISNSSNSGGGGYSSGGYSSGGYSGGGDCGGGDCGGGDGGGGDCGGGDGGGG
ncbi:DUF2207 domain-containing protein [Anabaena sp. UHCC 0204]|uniref:DUF2207 domain-containing protein n=1 Tax=Anabaena sp. UHCC 0204 TaxID=2590009 RepID=UPI0014478B2F|nr:DUF2207 domain-containing protein [Anabaena sp. UHCC 0204]MTJ10665.1 DUF2207 domain-containing protein [Anabaena sp. UHCC 0204]